MHSAVAVVAAQPLESTHVYSSESSQSVPACYVVFFIFGGFVIQQLCPPAPSWRARRCSQTLVSCARECRYVSDIHRQISTKFHILASAAVLVCTRRITGWLGVRFLFLFLFLMMFLSFSFTAAGALSWKVRRVSDSRGGFLVSALALYAQQKGYDTELKMSHVAYRLARYYYFTVRSTSVHTIIWCPSYDTW